MRIGIVIPNVPGYSETFFNSMINGLLDSKMDVVVFAKNKGNVRTAYQVRTPRKIYKNTLLALTQSCMILLSLIASRLNATIRYCSISYSDGANFKEVLKGLINNSHIISSRIDWLYFGFATMALGKEHVASSLNARMAVSLRGYDVAITPVGKPGLYNRVWKFVDKIHFLSEDLLNRAYNLGLSADSETVKITPAIDVSKFNLKPVKPTQARTIKIVTVARLHWKKGLDYALIAMKMLMDRNIDFEYTIVGRGDEHEHLCYMIHDLGLGGKVVLEGSKDHNDIPAILQQNSIFLMPSVSEGFCNAVLEAQATGLYCVVTNAEGLSENIENGKTGVVVSRRDPLAISEAIVHASQRSVMEVAEDATYARKRIESRFNLKKHINEWVAFFHLQDD